MSTTHLVEEGYGLTVCCIRNPLELPRYDKISSRAAERTCEEAYPRTWPDHTFPSAEQLHEWLRACPPGYPPAIRLLRLALEDAGTAQRCRLMNHEGLQRTVDGQARRIAQLVLGHG